MNSRPDTISGALRFRGAGIRERLTTLDRKDDSPAAIPGYAWRDPRRRRISGATLLSVCPPGSVLRRAVSGGGRVAWRNGP